MKKNPPFLLFFIVKTHFQRDRKLPKRDAKWTNLFSNACIHVGSLSMSFGSNFFFELHTFKVESMKKVSFSKEKRKLQLESPEPQGFLEPKYIEKLFTFTQATEEKLVHFTSFVKMAIYNQKQQVCRYFFDSFV